MGPEWCGCNGVQQPSCISSEALNSSGTIAQPGLREGLSRGRCAPGDPRFLIQSVRDGCLRRDGILGLAAGRNRVAEGSTVRELLMALARLVDGIPAGLRFVGMALATLFFIGLGLWLAVATLGGQGQVALIGSGLLLIGLLVVLVSGVLGAFRNPATMLWSGLALLALAIVLAMPWGAWWSGADATGPAGGGAGPVESVVSGGALGLSQQPLVAALLDRDRSPAGLSVLDVWVVLMALLNAVLAAQVLGRRRSPASWIAVNGVAVSALLLIGLVMVHAGG